MKIKKLILIGILLLFLIGTVNAQDNETTDDTIGIEPAESIAIKENPHEVELLKENENASVEDDYCAVFIPKESSSDGMDIVSVEYMPYDATGNISISVDDVERYNQKVSVGGNALFLGDLNLAYCTHNIAVSYTGDIKYHSFVKTATFEKTYIHVDFTAYSSNQPSVDFHVTLDKGVTGNIEVILDNKVVYNEKYVKEIELSVDGDYSTYEVHYSNGNQNKLTKKGSLDESSEMISIQFARYPHNIYYGNPTYFEVENYDYDRVEAKINNQTYICKYENFNWRLYLYSQIDSLDIGENIIQFTAYKGKIKQTINCSVFVSPQIDIPTVMCANRSYDLIFSGNHNCNGNLTLSGMVNETFKVNDGNLIVPIKSPQKGNYRLDVTYDNNCHYHYDIQVLEGLQDVSVIIDNIEVLREIYILVEPNLENFTSNKYRYGDEKVELTGKTTIYVDDTVIKEYDEPTHVCLNVEDYAIGNHTIKVVYSGDEIFKEMTKTLNFTVSHGICSINQYGTITVTMIEKASGTITVKVNGKVQKKIKVKFNGNYGWAEYDSYSIKLAYLFKSNKKYTIEVYFKDDTGKYSFNKTFDFKLKCPIEYTGDIFIDYGKEADITFSVPKDIKNKPSVTIDGKSYGYTSDYRVKVGAYDLSPGKHTIIISYPGDSKYCPNSISEELSISGAIREDPEEFLHLELPNDAKGDLIVKIKYTNGTENLISSPLKNGKATIMLPIGMYTYISYYSGTDYEVLKVEDDAENYFHCPIKIKYSPSVLNYGDNEQIKLKYLNKLDNPKIIFYLGSETGYRLPVAEFSLNHINNTLTINKEFVDNILKNNMARMMIDSNYEMDKDYYLDLYFAVYWENTMFYKDTMTVNFNTLSGIDDIDMNYGDSKTITFKAYNILDKKIGKNQVVKIKIGKYVFQVKTNKKGIAKFKIPNEIAPGEYKITAAYKNTKFTKKLIINHIISLKTVTVKKSAKKLLLKAKLPKKLKEKTVTFKFNGKKYTAKISKKEIAKVKIPKSELSKLKVGKKLTYSATYLKDTVKKRVKIQK